LPIAPSADSTAYPPRSSAVPATSDAEAIAEARRLDERIEGLSSEIETVARQDAGCDRLMSVLGIGPIISSAMRSRTRCSVRPGARGQRFCRLERHLSGSQSSV
jgi:hypothetical protein